MVSALTTGPLTMRSRERQHRVSVPIGAPSAFTRSYGATGRGRPSLNLVKPCK
jgi:hypothetical protein